MPACTAEIADIGNDQTNDNDGADGIIDIDKDGDGLIEICDLDGLSEMHHQLDRSSNEIGLFVVTANIVLCFWLHSVAIDTHSWGW